MDDERPIDGGALGEAPRVLQRDRRLGNHEVGVIAVITERPPAPAGDARWGCPSHRHRLRSHPIAGEIATVTPITVTPTTSTMSSASIIAPPPSRERAVPRATVLPLREIR